jgi:hypothetical protein
VAYFSETRACLDPPDLAALQKQVLASPQLAANSLTSDFVGTRGFSVVFTREGIPQVVQRWSAFGPYLDRLLDPACNAFYLNPLILVGGSRVDPHIDRSLRAYCKTVDTPALVSVLYVQVPENLVGGELVLRHGKRQVGRVVPEVNKVVRFQGDLSHEVTAVGEAASGRRLSVVCEQYMLEPAPLAEIPTFLVEGQRKRY